MALVLVKEDGTGKSTANSYASVADADAYHEGHLYPQAWAAATPEQKTAALVMASRVIDAEYQFNGVKSSSNQALQWPRALCLDPDSQSVRITPLLGMRGAYVPSNVVPRALVDAACEMARELLIVDRTAAPPGEGIAKQHNADYSETVYSKPDTRKIMTQLAQAMLRKYGCMFSATSGTARLVRV